MRQIVDRLSLLLKDVDDAGLNDNMPVSQSSTPDVATTKQEDAEHMIVTELSVHTSSESKELSGPISKDQRAQI